jgi:hypothetical protein
MMVSSQKQEVYEVSCRQCGIRKTFKSQLEADFFRMDHEEHDVKPVRSPVKETPSLDAALTRPRDEKAVAVEKVTVDVTGDSGESKFLVTGMINREPVFEKRFGAEEEKEVGHMIRSLQFTDEQGKAYTWTPDCVDLSYDAKELLASVGREGSKPEEPMATELVPSNREVDVLVTETGSGVMTPLLGKYSYVQTGPYYKEATQRVSDVLREYRWSIEPPYVIGVLFDDLLSVQSQNGKVAGDMIEKVEALGYHFVAVDAPNGVVTAWFKADGKAGKPVEVGRDSAQVVSELKAAPSEAEAGAGSPFALPRSEETQYAL